MHPHPTMDHIFWESMRDRRKYMFAVNQNGEFLYFGESSSFQVNLLFENSCSFLGFIWKNQYHCIKTDIADNRHQYDWIVTMGSIIAS